MRKGQRFVSSCSHITTKSGDTCLGCCAQTALVLWFVLKRGLREKKDIESWFRVRICRWCNLRWSGLNCFDSDFRWRVCLFPAWCALKWQKHWSNFSHVSGGGEGISVPLNFRPTWSQRLFVPLFNSGARAGSRGSISFLSFLWSWVSFHHSCSQGRLSFLT